MDALTNQIYSPDNDSKVDDEQSATPTVDAVLDAQKTSQQKIDDAVNAQPAPEPPNFQDHLNAFGAVLNGVVNAENKSGTFMGRWDPADAGSIARRDYFDLGIQNPSQFDSQDLKDDAAVLKSIFGNTPEAALLNEDANPAAAQSALARRDVAAKGAAYLNRDTRFANFPQARAIVKPIMPGQYGPGNVANTVKATPATMPSSFKNQFPKPPKI